MAEVDDFIEDTIGRLDRVIDVIEARAEEMRGKSKKLPFAAKFDRGTYSGWAAASEADADLLKSIRNRIAGDYMGKAA